MNRYALTDKHTGEMVSFKRNRSRTRSSRVTWYRIKHDAKVAAITALVVLALV